MTEGLIGLYGHTYVNDERGRVIQCQFRIIRKMDDDRYIFQFFSFADGEPTNLGTMTEAELLGPDVKLYANEALWLRAYEKDTIRGGNNDA